MLLVLQHLCLPGPEQQSLDFRDLPERIEVQDGISVTLGQAAESTYVLKRLGISQVHAKLLFDGNVLKMMMLGRNPAVVDSRYVQRGQVSAIS